MYKVIAYDPKSAKPRSPGQISPEKEKFLQQYYRDRRSVYMGNLPLNMDEETLTGLVSPCGEVLGVILFKKHVPGSAGMPFSQFRPPITAHANQVGKMTCFAFVEFARPNCADDAIMAYVCALILPYLSTKPH